MESPTERRLSNSRFVVLISMAVLFTGCYVGVAPLMEALRPRDTGAIVVYFCFGAIPAAAVLTVVAGALGPGHVLVRVSITFGIALGLWACWIAGLAWTYYRHDEDAVGIVCYLPLAFLSLGTPLWLFRTLLGWRIVVGESRGATASEALTIRDVMMTTAAVAVALALLQVSPYLGPRAELPLVAAMVAAACGGLTLLGAVPILSAILRARRLGIGICVALAYGVAATLIFVAILCVVQRGIFDTWEVIGLATTGLSFVGCQVIVLALCRQLGCRLVSRRAGGTGR